MPTITDQANEVGWGPSSYYSPAGSPWWVLNGDWNYPPAGSQWIDYNTSDLSQWNDHPLELWPSKVAPSNVWGYPEVVYGSQGHSSSFEPPNGIRPANWGEQIGTLGHFNMTWDVTLTGQSNLNQYDVLAETFLGGKEFGIVLGAYPDFIDYVENSAGLTAHPFNLGGLQGDAFPNAWGDGT